MILDVCCLKSTSSQKLQSDIDGFLSSITHSYFQDLCGFLIAVLGDDGELYIVILW